MRKFKCHSQKEEDWPGFVIEADFPDKIMICIPLTNLIQNNMEDVFLLFPEKNEENGN